MDDPFSYGQIVAANSVSDVYALGGRPIIALNIVGFPSKVLPLETLGAILAGGAAKAAEAGVTIVGGHTVEDPEPKYGMAVTGLVDLALAVLNKGARPGDRLLLTKPIGTGIVSNAIKRGTASAEAIEEAILSMTTLNRSSSEIMVRHRAHACTDVTGFGLLGHLHNVLAASGAAARITASTVPLLRGAEAPDGNFPGGSRRNLEAARSYTVFGAGVSEWKRLLLADAQTSGGLLIACARETAPAMLAELCGAGARAADIGEVVAGASGSIEVV